MSRLHFTIVVLLILCGVQMSAQDTYYYNAGEKVTLQCYPQRQFVLFQSSDDTVTAIKLIDPSRNSTQLFSSFFNGEPSINGL